MGSYRFYACPEGVIRIEDLPPKWGLFYFTPRKSLKAIHVPDMQISSLYSPQHYLNMIARRSPNGKMPPYLLHYQKMVEDFGHVVKNTVAEHNILYGAWRQLCIAQTRGVAYTVNEVFQRPNI